jgi:hypothetical protein
MDIVTAIAAISTVVKNAIDFAKSAGDARVARALSEVSDKLLDLQSVAIGIQSENARLQREMDDLRRNRDVRSKVEFRHGLYYAKEPIEGYGQGPFCSKCLDVDETLVCMIGPGRFKGKKNIEDEHLAAWSCPKCHA